MYSGGGLLIPLLVPAADILPGRSADRNLPSGLKAHHFTDKALWTRTYMESHYIEWCKKFSGVKDLFVQCRLNRASPLHNVHFGYYDGPVVKMALYMLQGHIM